MLDLLRSIHFGQNSSLAFSDFSAAFSSLDSGFGDSREPLAPQAPTTQETGFANAPVYQLITLLAQTHTIAMAFEPMIRNTSACVQKGLFRERCPYIPLIASTELRQMKADLVSAFTAWQLAHLGSATREVALMYHLGRMYLALPSLQSLVELSGYLPRSISLRTEATAARNARILSDLEVGQEAADHAWQILELSSPMTSVAASSWSPVALFYAGLVVWAQVSTAGRSGIHGSLKVLDLFQAQLFSMDSPCCHEMAQALKRLRMMKFG